MSYDIVTIGSIHCVIMRKELGVPLDCPADFTGPYPSGDPAIMIHAAARLGAKCGIISVTGNDAFGRCATGKLESAGVDCRMVRKDRESSTGVAFVCYYEDGSREFLFHVRESASGKLNEEDVDIDKLRGTKWVHISGFTIMLSESSRRAVYKILDQLPTGTRISFDPNVRLESSGLEEIKKYCAPVIEKASIIFPSRKEAAAFTGCETDDDGCRLWAEQGKTVVFKNGAKGSSIYHSNQIIDVPAPAVKEIDPTGAGDTFCGAYLTAWIEGQSLIECGRFANAAGALSVGKIGPMEGAPTREELERYRQYCRRTCGMQEV